MGLGPKICAECLDYIDNNECPYDKYHVTTFLFCLDYIKCCKWDNKHGTNLRKTHIDNPNNKVKS